MLSLCTGIGGIDLAAQWAGIETIAFCEINSFCQKVLRKQWPGVPIYEDIRKLRGDVFGPVDIMAAGYPCQPYSYPGQRKGEKDDRALWPEVFKRIREIRPRWFVGENVAGHVSLGLDDVLSDMENIGYTTQPFVIPAAGVGAEHIRMRTVWVANSNGILGETWFQFLKDRTIKIPETYPGECLPYVRREVYSDSRTSGKNDGVPSGMDANRIKALGNSVMPQQIYPIFKAIMEIEREWSN